MPTTYDANGWKAHSQLVMSKLDDLHTVTKELTHEVQAVRVEVAVLKVKAGIWGAVAGAIPVIIGLGLLLLKGAIGSP